MIWRLFLCWLGRHEYEWGGRHLISSHAIQPWSRLDTKLQTVGPQPGKSVFEELR